jgi:hypothetical protein
VAWAKFAEAALASCAVGPRNRWAAESYFVGALHYGLPGEVDVKHATGQEILDGSSTNSLSW